MISLLDFGCSAEAVVQLTSLKLARLVPVEVLVHKDLCFIVPCPWQLSEAVQCQVCERNVLLLLLFPHFKLCGHQPFSNLLQSAKLVEN